MGSLFSECPIHVIIFRVSSIYFDALEFEVELCFTIVLDDVSFL